MRSRPGARSTAARNVSPSGNGGAQCGSPGIGTAVASSQAAASRTVRVSGPCQARPLTSPATGPLLTRPRLTFNPTRPHTLAGMRTEPPPSLPWANGARPAATAAPAPPLEPPADFDRSHGVRAGGATSGSVYAGAPNSAAFDLPSVTVPAR